MCKMDSEDKFALSVIITGGIIIVAVILSIAAIAHGATHAVAIEWTTDSSLVAKVDSIGSLCDTVGYVKSMDTLIGDCLGVYYETEPYHILVVAPLPVEPGRMGRNEGGCDSVGLMKYQRMGWDIAIYPEGCWTTYEVKRFPSVKRALILYETEER